MRIINLTIDIDVNDSAFEELEGFVKFNIGEIIQSRRINISDARELYKLRGQLVAEEILKTDQNLLIGFAVKELMHLTDIQSLVNPKNISISKIFFGNSKRKKVKIEKYKNSYSKYSRWLDYSPEFIENQHELFEEKVKEIITAARKHDIEVIEI